MLLIPIATPGYHRVKGKRGDERRSSHRHLYPRNILNTYVTPAPRLCKRGVKACTVRGEVIYCQPIPGTLTNFAHAERKDVQAPL